MISQTGVCAAVAAVAVVAAQRLPRPVAQAVVAGARTAEWQVLAASAVEVGLPVLAAEMAALVAAVDTRILA